MAYGSLPSLPDDLRPVARSVLAMAAQYGNQRGWTGKHAELFGVFFAVSQTHLPLEEYYRLVIAVPLLLMEASCSLYLCQGEGRELYLACSGERGLLAEGEPAPAGIRLKDVPYQEAGLHVFPVYKTHACREQANPGGERNSGPDGCFLGMLAVRRPEGLSEADTFFFAQYAGHVAAGLHNRSLYRQHTEKWDFINTLIADIEHNIIVPNMYFRHLFNSLEKKFGLLEGMRREIEEALAEIRQRGGMVPERCEYCSATLHSLEKDLREDHRQILRHYNNMSLFIESLFRREHFARGHLVLHPRRCFLEKEVIIPQLEQYVQRLQQAGITVERPQNMYEEEFPIQVDIGLLAQVYANLFSNAVKYTKEIISGWGLPRKAMAYGREIVNDFPEKGQKGIKCNVFTTGPSMPVSEGMRLFQDGVRGGDAALNGSGHGLSFIRHVIETHGGSIGYEPTPEGNNFYFILPLPPLEYPLIPLSAKV